MLLTNNEKIIKFEVSSTVSGSLGSLLFRDMIEIMIEGTIKSCRPYRCITHINW